MADGQIFSLTPCPPGQKYAVEDTLAATTTATGGPYDVMPVWAFDAATAAYMDFYTVFYGLGTGEVWLRYNFLCSSTATLGVRFRGGIRLYDSANSVIASHTFSYIESLAETPGTANGLDGGIIQFTATYITTASIGDGSAAMVRFYRDATATWDTLTTNAYVYQGGMTLQEN